ncbi:MAG: DNA polymerase III subunit delta' [Gammaproteobacteria bacterium RIFCSPHIGHO2_12_FULL_35_23]|nr:MAG: DNA polymerase III subunit delta' [Gammaproteobacteria bacterium RIFCSPHIGHO2_12_FULL_35_23]
MMQTILPWQIKQWEVFKASLLNNKIAHAYLLVGLSGLGKLNFATVLSQILLCEKINNQGFACLNCQSCKLFQAKTHPDYQLITPLEEGKIIKISQVRELIESVTKTPQVSKYKVIVLSPADAMNKAAANALLKTLEEPAGNTIIILISNQPHNLPATVQSRCSKIKFNVPAEAIASHWLIEQIEDKKEVKVLLKLAFGSPLKALAIKESVEFEYRRQWFTEWLAWQEGRIAFHEIVAKWQEFPLEMVLNHWLTWLTDLLQLALTGSNNFIINIDFTDSLCKLSERLNPYLLSKYVNYSQEKRNLLLSQVSVNSQLLLEDLLIKWQALLEAKENTHVG